HAIGETEYFVIEQGSIGNFVTSKPTEKRMLIEEAAGTAYYKDKRRQAQTKLENTGQNLIRLEDIIIEVEKAKNSLQRQAQAANRYRRLRERIRELTSHHYQRKLVLLENSQGEATALYEAGLLREQDVTARLRSEEKDAAARRKDLWDLEKGLKESQEKLFGLKSLVARVESDIERESKRVEFFEEKKKRSESDRDELLEDVLMLTREFEDFRARLGGFEETLGTNRSDVGRAEADLEAARQARLAEEKDIERLRGDYLQALQGLTEAKNESVRTDKEIELLSRQEEKLAAQLGEQAGLQVETADRMGILERDINEHRDLRQALVSQAEDVKTALGSLRLSLEETRRRLEALKTRRDGSAYHLQALRKIDEKERGESPADEVPGGLGILADLIRTNPENALLFDTFWREGARSRVVPAEDFLRGIPAGLRGNYLLIPATARPAIPEEILGRPGFLGLLKSLIEPDDRLKDRLPGLEDAVIVKDAGEAVRAWVEYPGLNFLTPSGDLLLASGLLRLGEKAEGAIALASEMRRLDAEIARLESESLPVTADLEEKQKGIGALEAELAGVRESLERAERVLQDREREHRYGLGESERIRTTQAILGRELGLLRDEKVRLGEILRSTGEGLTLRESETRELKERIEAKEMALAALTAEAAGLERRFFETKAGLDLVQEKMNGIGDQMRATAKRKEAATAKIQQLEADARVSDEDKVRLRDEILALRESAKT
ncbi:MAG: hypothetical protein NT147_09850, partial [Candidatus Aminicenantes bacterium]|nr:hypothetical protein [Candidatus Aminicenantes bacterium]